MKFHKCCEEEKKSDTPDVCLKLSHGVDGSVTVLACDPVTGKRHLGGNLLTFNTSGTIDLHGFVGINLGFKLKNNTVVVN